MINLENEIVEHKHALAIKEIGFNEPCFGVFDCYYNFQLDYRETQYDANKGWVDGILAPTYDQAFRFFRDKHNIFVEFHVEGAVGNPIGYSASINVKDGKYIFPWEIVESQEVLSYEKLRPIVLNFCIEIALKISIK